MRVDETECERFALVDIELRRIDIAQHGQMASGGLQILTDGEHVYVVNVDAQHPDDFFVGFT
jgi:hypothetical protein